MTNDRYKSPAVLSSEAVMLPAGESADMGARSRTHPALDTVRRKDTRLFAARQAQTSAVNPAQWIEPHKETLPTLHNEAQGSQPGPWLGRAALRSITSGMPAPQPEGAAAPTVPVQPLPSTRGVLRSVVTDLLGGRGGQGAHFHPVTDGADPRMTLSAGQYLTD